MANQSVASDDLAKVRKSFMKVSKGEDLRKDAVIMYARDIKWEEFLEPAPLSVALLGQLLLVAGNKDFTLEKHPPKEGFKLIKYPNSFRASLVQVSNEGWVAFNEAHTNMDQIRLHTQNVPGHLKAAVKIILTGTNHDIAYTLEEPLGSIQYIADECLALASKTEAKFVGMVQLIGELIEACTNARGRYEEDIQMKRMALEIAEESKQRAEKQAEFAEKHLKRLEREVEREHQNYKDSMNSGAGFMHGVSTLVNGVAKAASTIHAIINPINNLVDKMHHRQHTPNAGDHQQNDSSKEAKQKIYILAEEIKKLVDSLATVITDVNVCGDEKRMLRIIVTAKRLQTNLQMEDICEEKATAIAIVGKSLLIANKIKESNHAMIKDQSTLRAEFGRDMDDLKEKSTMLYGKACAGRGGVSMASTPRMSKVSETQTDGMNEFNFKLNMQCEMLKHQQKRYDDAFDKFSESSEKITKTMLEISKYKFEVIDFQAIRDVLMKGIKSLAEVREEWGKMVRFFQSISNLIKCTLNTSLKTFSGMITKGKDMKQDGITLSDCMVDQIYTNTFEAAKIAHVVNNVAGMYVEVSDKYLMDRVASLGKLVALDPEKESHLMRLKMQELTNDCTQTQNHIREMARKKQLEFKRVVEDRIQQLETELRPVMSSVPVATDAQNKQLAIAAIAEEEDEMDQFA